MKVNVNVFKASGKWYARGELDLPPMSPTFGIHRDDFDDKIRDMIKGSILNGRGEEFFIVVTHKDTYEIDPFDDFFCHLIKPIIQTPT